MAIPNNYIDKITDMDSGESRIISPAADKVRVDNENFEGTDLDEVLDEVAQAIDEAGSGDGTVTGVKVGNTTYDPTEGVVDLSTPFGGKVDKNGTDSLMTAAEHTKLQNLPTAETLTQQFGSKANDADVVKSVSVNNVAQQKTGGNVNITVPSMTMDEVPTAGSNNAVKSGGIKTAIDNATPTIDPTTKKWIVGGQLTNIVAEGQDGQDGNSGVASADGVESVNNLNGGTTDTDAKVYVLGANQGAVIKAILDKTYRSASTGDTSTVIVEVTHTMKAGTGESALGAAIVQGQRKPGTGGMNNLDTAANSGRSRECVNTYFIRKGAADGVGTPIPFPDKFTVVLPTGYSMAINGCDTLVETDATKIWDTAWQTDGAEIDLTADGYGNVAGDRTYYTINFKTPSGNAPSAAELATLNSTFAIVWTEEEEQEIVGPAAGKAMEFIGANGQVAKTVYCKEDNGNNVQVYTKEAVDALVGQSPTGIIARNQEAIHRIWAARKHFDMNHQGSYTVYNHENNFCIAHGSDFHVDVDRLENFRDFVDGVDSIDAAIITGDFTSNGTDTEFNAMMGVEFDRIEPLRCIGNHDRDGGKNLAQIATALDMDNDYYVNDDYVADFGIRIIVLNRYDVASTTKSVAQRDGHFSQTQINWFITKLKESITNSYHVIVAMHAIDNIYGASSIRTAQNDKGFWQRWWQNEGTSTTQTSGTIIEDIIAAFRTGGSVNGTYSHNDGTTSVTVNDSFSGNGKFVCYMVGHCHIDMIGYSRTHPDQLYLAAPTASCIGLNQSSQEYACGTQVLDLPRVAGTKTEDCFNVYAFDTTNKIVKVVRVGADMNDLMEKREVAFYDYEPTLNND